MKFLSPMHDDKINAHAGLEISLNKHLPCIIKIIGIYGRGQKYFNIALVLQDNSHSSCKHIHCPLKEYAIKNIGE